MNSNSSSNTNRLRRAALVAFSLLAIAATSAFALVKVYSNDFSSQVEADQLLIEGKSCEKDWDKEGKRLFVIAKSGPARCRLKVPVQGDSPQPNQAVLVTTKLEKNLPSSILRKTYLAVTIRDGSG